MTNNAPDMSEAIRVGILQERIVAYQQEKERIVTLLKDQFKLELFDRHDDQCLLALDHGGYRLISDPLTSREVELLDTYFNSPQNTPVLRS